MLKNWKAFLAAFGIFAGGLSALSKDIVDGADAAQWTRDMSVILGGIMGMWHIWQQRNQIKALQCKVDRLLGSSDDPQFKE